MITDESNELGSVFLFVVFWVCLHDPKTVTSMLLCINVQLFLHTFEWLFAPLLQQIYYATS